MSKQSTLALVILLGGLTSILARPVRAQCPTYSSEWCIGGGGVENVATDPEGNVYVLSDGLVKKFSNTGTYITEWGPLDAASGLDTDPVGNVYVLCDEAGSRRVQKFTSTGTYITHWEVDLNTSIRVAADAAGNVYVLDNYGTAGPIVGKVRKYTNIGVYLTEWSLPPGSYPYFDPMYLATDAGDVFVSDRGGRIKKFTNTGTYLTEWVLSGYPSGRVSTGVATDAADNVYVLDNYSTGNNLSARVHKFTNTGTYLCEFGEGVLVYADAVAIDGAGNAFVVSSGCDPQFPAPTVHRYQSGPTPTIGLSWGRLKSIYR